MSIPLESLALTAAIAVLLWLLSLKLRDASIIDIYWGPGIALVADLTAWLVHPAGERAAAVLFLVNCWGLRLGAHIFARHRHAGEDSRYAAMRKKFGPRWWWMSLVQVFLLQAILIWFIASPLVAALLASRAALTVLDYAGLALAGFGLVFEALADFQLMRFRADTGNRGEVLRTGLWAWSRHPNYFGEAAMWWGYFLVGYAASGAAWLVLSPLLVTGLLLKVSGVSLMEDTITSRRPGYAAYQREVSSFIPWLPKR
jgi:steroid 5-alpha reductase family enzyme